VNGGGPGRPVRILLVDDNRADIRLTQEALREGTLTTEVHVARDGEEALQFLRRADGFAGRPRPDLILLDLNMPRMDGREVLGELKADADLRTIPVVVLTTSTARSDIESSYNLHANCYVVKPLDFDQFARTVRAIEAFWFSGVVKLPTL
jgi:CheY-like chemotaxis protein